MSGSQHMEPDIFGTVGLAPLFSSLAHEYNNRVGSVFLNADWIASLHPDTAQATEEIKQCIRALGEQAKGIDLLLRGRPGEPTRVPLLESAVACLLQLLQASRDGEFEFVREHRGNAEVPRPRHLAHLLLQVGVSISGDRKGTRLALRTTERPDGFLFRFEISPWHAPPDAAQRELLESLAHGAGCRSTAADRGWEIFMPLEEARNA